MVDKAKQASKATHTIISISKHAAVGVLGGEGEGRQKWMNTTHSRQRRPMPRRARLLLSWFQPQLPSLSRAWLGPASARVCMRWTSHGTWAKLAVEGYGPRGSGGVATDNSPRPYASPHFSLPPTLMLNQLTSAATVSETYLFRIYVWACLGVLGDLLCAHYHWMWPQRGQHEPLHARLVHVSSGQRGPTEHAPMGQPAHGFCRLFRRP